MAAATATQAPNWLTTAEAAPHLRKTPETLINWATSGRIPPYAWRALPKGYLFLASWIVDPVFTCARPSQKLDEQGEMVANAGK